jgi:hypothetical protein
MLRSPPGGQWDAVRPVPRAPVAAVVTVNLTGSLRIEQANVHHPSGRPASTALGGSAASMILSGFALGSAICCLSDRQRYLRR